MGEGESRWSRVARFRLENEMREGRYSEEEVNRICRLCEERLEACEHAWKECRKWNEKGRSW